MANKAPTKKTPATPTKKPSASNGRPAGLFTWLAVGLVVVVVVALVVIKVVSGSPKSTNSSAFDPITATEQADLTTIPLSVFNTIGTTSSVAEVTPPIPLKHQPLLEGTSAVTGKQVPEVLYLGAEYCPFCAAQRWVTIIALSRFGTWSGLGQTASSSIDSYPSTPTFTFLKAKYSSRYLAFSGIEQYNNVYTGNANAPYTKLMKTTTQEQDLFNKYDTPTYVPGMTSSDIGSIPFIDMGNQYLVSGASYSPALLHGLTHSDIASALSSPASPVTDAIIASANYETAAFCKLTNEQPAAVCTSSGVKKAAAKL